MTRIKVTLKTIWIGTVLGLVIVLFAVMAMFRGELGWGSLFVIVISLFIGLLICLPLAEAISQKLMSKVFAFNKGKVSGDYSRAKRLLVEERFEEAIAEFRRALEEEPEQLTIQIEIAEIYACDLHDYQRAIEEYEKALVLPAMDSQRVSILNRIADIYETGLGDSDMAVRTLSRIVESLPGTKFAHKAAERIAAIKASHRPQKLSPGKRA